MSDLTPEQIKKLSDSLRGLEVRTNALDDAEKELDIIVKKNTEGLKALNSYLGNLGKTVASAEQGSAKYGKTITGATDAAGDLIGKFGFLGAAIGAVIKAIGGLAAASLKQNDALIKSYRTLSDFGNIDPRGLQGVLDTMIKMGANSENMENFQRVLRGIAPDLVLFGGTVNSGVQKIADVTNTILNSDLNRQLKNLGYSTEDISKSTANIIASALRSGLSIDKTTGSLTRTAGEFMKVFSELSILTGKNRDEQQKVFDDMNRDLAFRAYLRDIEKTGKKEDIEFANRLRVSVAATTLVNEEMGKYAMETIVNEGGVVTSEMARLQALHGDLGMTIRDTARSSRDVEQAAKSTLGVLKNNLPGMSRWIDSTSALSKINAEASDALGSNVKLYDSELVLRNMDLKASEKLIQDAVRLGNANNKRIEDDTKRETAERLTRNAMERLYYVVGDMTTPAVAGLAKMINVLGRVIADTVFWITDKMGKFFGTGVIDFRDSFKEFTTMADVVTEINDQNKRQVEINKERLEIDERLAKVNEQILKEQEGREKFVRQYGGADTSSNAEARRIAAKKYDETNLKGLYSERDTLTSRKGYLGSALTMSQQAQATAKASATGMTGGAGLKYHTEGALAGLVTKIGDVHREGSALDPRLKALAEQIPGKIGDFAYFSSFNDEFHKGMASKHKEGKALDFVLRNSIAGNKEAGNAIIAQLRALGFNGTIKDEYNDPTLLPNGEYAKGHIHAEIAGKTQGLFRGPESGYYLKAHGTEALLNQQGLSNLITKAQVAGPGSLSGDNFNKLIDAIFEMSEKLDTVVDKLEKGNNTQREILEHSKV